MSEKAKLLERIRAADGPDRELDEQLALAIGGWKQSEDSHYTESPEGLDYYYPSEHWPHYTASIDAALALVTKLLPGRWWVLNSGLEAGSATCLIDAGKPFETHNDHGATPPLAILASLLTALIAQPKPGET